MRLANGRRVRDGWMVRWGGVALVVCSLLLLAACVATPSSDQVLTGLLKVKPKPRATPTPTATATTPPSGPPAPPPYSFPEQWTAVPNVPATVASFAMASSDPRTGYLCAASAAATGNIAPITGPGTAPLGARTAPRSGLPAIFITHDAGTTWTGENPGFAPSPVCQVTVDENNPNDVFVFHADLDSSGQIAGYSFWRSEDGGATWARLTIPQAQGYLLGIASVAVVNSRLVVGVTPEQDANPLQDPLYASDDGGTTWHSIAGQLSDATGTLTPGAILMPVGTTLVIQAGHLCQGGCGYTAPLAPGAQHVWSAAPLRGPASNATTAQTYFQSTDGGTTWSQMTSVPANAQGLKFFRAQDGSHYYGLALTTAPSATSVVTTAYLSTDSGATWQALPTLAGVGGGYPDPGTLGQTGVLVTPDGRVLASAAHLTSDSESDAGIFRLVPGSGAQWQVLAPSLYYFDWQAVPTASGWRMLAIASGTTQPGSTLSSLDLP